MAGLQFPIAAVGHEAALLAGHCLSCGAAVFLAAVLECTSAEILKLSGNNARAAKCSEISARHVLLAIKGDTELNRMFGNAALVNAGH